MSGDLERSTTIPRWRWRSGNPAARDHRVVTFGRDGDDRWYADASGLNAPFYFDDYGAAFRLAQTWLDAGSWVETPAAYDEIGRPDDGGRWVRRGGVWFPA